MRTWLALIVAPSLVLACLGVNYALVSTMAAPCSAASVAPLNSVSVASFAVCVVASIAAWLRWRSARAGIPSDSSARPARAGFVASVAIGVGVLSALSVLAISIPQWLLSPC
ncbi:hypothetical protein AWB67_05084 [Caballeronia terrestris]|jgi:hypothetical protein|uniref:Lipoprotein n=1 Tax=Caballeronia terrestris TaxID=1226301 RepID=A0A158K8E6_9BURK|nr:hypothetical protein [Caballeronia terrestris]SAL77398.1 hypothetical protein AWB67_05084 [Caballeronia terrestris]